MKTLTILRHAKSSWDDPRLDDFDRPLNDRGRKAARLVGRELKRRKVQFDQVIASPAVRIRETLEEFARGFETDLDVRFAPQIYNATEQQLEKVIRSLPEAVEAPLLVGHNPGLQELVLALAGDDEDGLRDRVAGKLPTAAVAFIEVPAKRWKDFQRGSGRIRDLIIPKELD